MNMCAESCNSLYFDIIRTADDAKIQKTIRKFEFLQGITKTV